MKALKSFNLLFGITVVILIISYFVNENLDSIRSYGESLRDESAKENAKKNSNRQLNSCLKPCAPNKYKPALDKCKMRRLQSCEKLLWKNDEKVIKKACEIGSSEGCLKASEFTNITSLEKLNYLKKSCNDFKGGSLDACVKLIPYYRKKDPSKAIRYSKWACMQGREILCN